MVVVFEAVEDNEGEVQRLGLERVRCGFCDFGYEKIKLITTPKSNQPASGSIFSKSAFYVLICQFDVAEGPSSKSTEHVSCCYARQSI